jgi:23S rRNA maturation mini-RNase III
METPEGHQKSVFNTSTMKKQRYIWDPIRESLHAQPETIKKNYRNPKSTSRNENFAKKNYVSFLKV